jgi:hypothetical protein
VRVIGYLLKHGCLGEAKATYPKPLLNRRAAKYKCLFNDPNTRATSRLIVNAYARGRFRSFPTSRSMPSAPISFAHVSVGRCSLFRKGELKDR